MKVIYFVVYWLVFNRTLSIYPFPAMHSFGNIGRMYCKITKMEVLFTLRYLIATVETATVRVYLMGETSL